MLQYLNQKRGQSTLEYAVLIVVIIGALMTIQVYIKRGVQGRLRSATDDIGDQFAPGNTNVVKVVKTFSNTSDQFNAGNSTSNLFNESTNTNANTEIMNVQQDFWGKAG